MQSDRPLRQAEAPGRAAGPSSVKDLIAGVSVIIPAYNYARYLPRAIDTVLNQTRRELEVLVIDDGSTDGTRAVVERYTDPRLRYIYQANAGLPAARNTGITQAKFPFVAFLDADDEWTPDFLSSAMAAFQTLPTEFAIVASRSLRIDPEGNSIPTCNPPMAADREVTAREIVMKTRFTPSAVVARKSAFETCGGFDTTLRSSEDREMWIRIAHKHRIHLLKESLVRVRKHSSNMSKNAGQMRTSKERVIAKARQTGVVSSFAFSFWLRVRAIHHFQVSWTFFEEGAALTACGHLLRSLLSWPFFLRPAEFNEPPFFRIRALRTFLLGVFRRAGASAGAGS